MTEESHSNKHSEGGKQEDFPKTLACNFIGGEEMMSLQWSSKNTPP